MGDFKPFASACRIEEKRVFYEIFIDSDSEICEMLNEIWQLFFASIHFEACTKYMLLTMTSY